MAGQSVISSSLNTTINGGSFRDNLVNAMLANIGNQINAEGAGLIGDNGEVLGLPGRALSHAVVSGISAEIGRGNGKGAAAGALAAELAAITLGEVFVEPDTRENHIPSAGRIIGALAGAAATNSSAGANSGGVAAENTLKYNFLMHDEPAEMAKKMVDCKGNTDCINNARKETIKKSNQNEQRFESCRVAGDGDCINEMLSGVSNANGYHELGLQLGFDISNAYKQMGSFAYDKFETCGWSVGTGCALKLWGNEAITEASSWAIGWGGGKYTLPYVGKYITEIGIFSQKGAFANIKSSQVGLRDPGMVDSIKNDMKSNKFEYSKMENIIAGYVDKNGKHVIHEGNHRAVAAKELYEETGDPVYIESLIKNGSWTYKDTYVGAVNKLPSRKK